MRMSRGCFAGAIGALAVVAALTCSLAWAQDQQRAEDRRQITDLLQRWETFWNTHDMRAFGELFHEDGVWVLWTGDVWRGRRTIQEGMARVHETVYRDSVQRERLEELTFVGPDAAVLRFESTLTGDTRQPDKVVRSRKILIVTRRDGTWRIGWGQNTRFADQPAK